MSSAATIDWDDVRRRLNEAEEATLQALELSPEHARRVMDERARRLAHVIEELSLGEDAFEVVTFTLGGERFAIETRYVKEVIPLVDYTPVPGIPEHFLGVTKLEGEILALVDLRKLFDMGIRGLTDLSRIVVLGEERPELGILADATHEVEMLRGGELVEPPPSVRDSDRECLRGVTSDAMTVLDGARLLGDERLLVDQSES